MVGLKLVPVAGPADAFQVFPAVWIPGSEFPDEPGGHDVVHVTLRSRFREAYAARCNLTLFA
jgi:hypothetical protein